MQLILEYILDRKRIIGVEISERLPNIVILELADAHRVKLDKKEFDVSASYIRGVVRSIRNTDVYKIRYPFTNLDRIRIADYLAISRDDLKNWTNEMLRKILSYWNMMLNNIEFLPEIISTRIGNPTIKYPYSINACFLYRFCQLRKIDVPYNISLKNLALMVSMLSNNRSEILNLIQSQLLHNNNRTQLLAILSNVEIKNGDLDILTSDDDQVFSTEILISKYRRLVKQPKLLIKSPRNNLEAIVLAAINFKANLLLVENPMEEYKFVKIYAQKNNDDPYFINYKPNDKKLRLGSLISLINFDSRIPEIFYPDNYLRIIATDNCRSILSEHNSYEYMQILHITESFYPSWHPNIVNTETPFSYENISEIRNDNLLAYGVASSSLVGISLDELIAMFRVNKSFKNDIIPDPNLKNFTDENILRLKKILMKSLVLNQEKCLECLSEINRIEIFNRDSTNKLREFSDYYHKSDQQKLIEYGLELYYHLALYMRSWNGNLANLPIEEAPVENQNLTDINVTEQVGKINNFKKENEQIMCLIESMPIFKFEDNKFVRDTDEDQGLTIGGRIKIVLTSNDNINSCIRMTSNYLAWTIYHIIEIIDRPVPFDISKFRIIS